MSRLFGGVTPGSSIVDRVVRRTRKGNKTSSSSTSTASETEDQEHEKRKRKEEHILEIFGSDDESGAEKDYEEESVQEDQEEESVQEDQENFDPPTSGQLETTRECVTEKPKVASRFPSREQLNAASAKNADRFRSNTEERQKKQDFFWHSGTEFAILQISLL